VDGLRAERAGLVSGALGAQPVHQVVVA